MAEKRFVVRLVRSPEATVPEDVLRRHQARLAELHAAGIVEHYGPVANNEGGIQVLKVETLDDADRFVREDPLVMAGFSRGIVWEWTRRP